MEKSEDFQLLIVPINDAYKFSNNKGNKVRNYFVSVVNAASKISYSAIIQYKPIDIKNGHKIKKGAIVDIYNGKTIPEDCNLRFITVYDYYLYEKNYKNNQLISTLNLEKKSTFKDDIKKQNNTNSASVCIDWYWVTTYSDGSQTSQYVTTTFAGGCGLSNPNDASICPDGGGGDGSGGADPDPGTNVVRTVTYTVREYETAYEHWKVVGAFIISGTKFNNIANNVFNSITGSGAACIIFSAAYSGHPNMPGYIIFSSSNSFGLLSATIASGSVTAYLQFPNWSSPRNEAYTLPHIWHASTDLF